MGSIRYGHSSGGAMGLYEPLANGASGLVASFLFMPTSPARLPRLLPTRVDEAMARSRQMLSLRCALPRAQPARTGTGGVLRRADEAFEG